MKQRLLPLLVAGAFPLVASNAHAAAFMLPEQGVSGLGNAYAGAAAAAEDASTLWWNPAGMSRLDSGKHFLAAGTVIMPSTKFTNNGSSGSGTNGGDAGSTALIPSFFFAMDINPDWSFGVGLTVPFGLKTEYEANWIGRFQGISSEVKTLNINPAISYKISKTASIALGVNYQQGEIDILTGVNLGVAEGQNKISLDGDAWGFNVGALFDVGPATRVGLHYRSSLDYSLKGDSSFSVPPPFSASPTFAAGPVTADLETPATASVSIAHKLNNNVELLGDITWTEWSRINRVPVLRSNGSTLSTLVFNFDDAWRYSFGVNYKLDGPWTLKGGLALDQTPVRSPEDRTVRLPDNDRTWLSVGATYRMSKASRFDFGYTYVMIKDADINNTSSGTVRGTYEANAHLFGVSYQHSF